MPLASKRISVKSLQAIYAGADVKRFHTMFTHREQLVGQHSFGVAWLCELLTANQASKNLIMAALAHDLGEVETGDIPAPFKRSLSAAARSELAFGEIMVLEDAALAYPLTAEEETILKVADALEGVLFCEREVRLGNREMNTVLMRFLSYIENLQDCPAKLTALEFLATRERNYNVRI